VVFDSVFCYLVWCVAFSAYKKAEEIWASQHEGEDDRMPAELLNNLGVACHRDGNPHFSSFSVLVMTRSFFFFFIGKLLEALSYYERAIDTCEKDDLMSLAERGQATSCFGSLAWDLPLFFLNRSKSIHAGDVEVQ
jgi:hypothetical protein